MQKYLLLIIVFLTGAAVLVIEVTATRILSVYFGNTIFTVSSVISVILLALSLGYFVGGRLADKRASELLFYQIIALSGLSVFLLQILKILFLPVISAQLSLQYGPLVVSVILFLLPGLLLGMLSPFVVKLQQIRMSSQGIGQVTGDVFFWSTLGSIMGSLLTGFYFIPHFGLNQIIAGTGMLLSLIGLAGIGGVQKTFFQTRIVVLLILLPIIQLGLVSMDKLARQDSIVYAEDGLYDSIVVYDGKYEGKKARFLQQATDESSAMYHESSELVYLYTKYYELYTLVNPDINHALVIGGGAYSVPKALLQNDSDVIVDVAEIEPAMLDVAKKHFKVPDTPRLVNHVEDGRRFLQDTDTRYDIIFTDAFHTSIPSHLTTKEFFAVTKEKLSDNGIYVMNIIGALNNKTPSFLMSEVKTFTSVYANSYLFAVYDTNSPYAQNMMLVGFKSDSPVDFTKIKTKDPYMAEVHTKLVDLRQFDFSAHPIFTDNYAPVEYFIQFHK